MLNYVIKYSEIQIRDKYSQNIIVNLIKCVVYY